MLVLKALNFDITTKLAAGALAALDAGDTAEHDRLAAQAARDLIDCDAIALGQFSLARAAGAVAAATGKRVLTTPDSAVLALNATQLISAVNSSKPSPVSGRHQKLNTRRISYSIFIGLLLHNPSAKGQLMESR